MNQGSRSCQFRKRRSKDGGDFYGRKKRGVPV